MDSKPNVIFISADSLRADHLACYGYPLSTSPHIDSIAAQGVVCEKMFCPVIPTQPSHTTMFTGQHPLTHGVVSHGGKRRLDRGAPFLPELLLEAGYTTCAVDTLFRERNWFNRGFEYIIDPSIHHVFYASVTQEELNHRAIQWMKSSAQSPFFLFIHYWDVHYPYTPPQAYSDLFYEGGNPTDPDNPALDKWWDHPIGAMARDTWLRTTDGLITDPEYVRALYDREIRYLDDGMASLDQALNELGIAGNTVFVFLADHGESMTEHGVFFDHYGLYDNTIRVPAILRWPDGDLKGGLRLPDTRQLFDIAPTLLEAAGVPIPSSMDGQSLLKQLRGLEEPSGYGTRYSNLVSLESTWQAKYCLRDGRYKLILARQPDLLGNPSRELYDLLKDPLETSNLADCEPDLASSMESALEEAIAARLKASGKTADPVVEEGASMITTWLGHRA
jgi:arylsulfatase A-like enzyme